MQKGLFLAILVAFTLQLQGQISTNYQVSFDNAVHHEAQIQATFTNLKAAEAEFRMSRTSPGRYALHEFVKNAYDVKVTDGTGKVLEKDSIDGKEVVTISLKVEDLQGEKKIIGQAIINSDL